MKFSLLLCVLSLALASSADAASPWMENCGVSKYGVAGSRNARIVGGSTAHPHEFPWQVSIWVISGSHDCGGTLINNRYVLTAGHCAKDYDISQMKVVVGEHDRVINEEAEHIYDVKGSAWPADYEVKDGYSAANDIALLMLEGEVEFNENVQPACKPAADDLYVGQTGVISGWGHEEWEGASYTRFLKFINLPIITNQACTFGNYTGHIRDTNICAGEAPYREKDACQGDSGGPMVVKDANDKYHLVGINSFGDVCAGGYPAAFTRVSSYLSWIEATIENWDT